MAHGRILVRLTGFEPALHCLKGSCPTLDDSRIERAACGLVTSRSDYGTVPHAASWYPARDSNPRMAVCRTAALAAWRAGQTGLRGKIRTCDFLSPGQAGWPLPYTQMVPLARIELAHLGLGLQAPTTGRGDKTT